jgi:hypothetical protein
MAHVPPLYTRTAEHTRCTLRTTPYTTPVPSSPIHACPPARHTRPARRQRPHIPFLQHSQQRHVVPIPCNTPSHGSPILQHATPLTLRLPSPYTYLEQTQGSSPRRVPQIIRIYITPNYSPQKTTHHPPQPATVTPKGIAGTTNPTTRTAQASPLPSHHHPTSQRANEARRRHTTVDPIRAPAHVSPTKTSQPPIYVPASPQGQQIARLPRSANGTMRTKIPSTPATR